MTKGISETAFASQVEYLLSLYHFRWCHFRPAYSNKGFRTPIRGGDPDGFKGKGYPDYCAVRDGRLLFIELKDKYSKASPAQMAWLNDLSRVKEVEVYLWRPEELEEISVILRS